MTQLSTRPFRMPAFRRPAWFSPRVLRVEVLAGLVVALALIPEAVSFSIIAGMDPRVGLFASFTMAVTISIVGGRPAMISAATGAVALVVAPLAREHGLPYLVAAVLLDGLLQILLADGGVAKLMRFLPRSVMVGFVNALAILILTSQLPYLTDVPVTVYVLVAVALAVMVGLPRLTGAVPAPLVAIIALTLFTVAAAVVVPTDRRSSRRSHSPSHSSGSSRPVDRQTGRRHHRHALEQDPRGLGARAWRTSSPASSAAWAGAP